MANTERDNKMIDILADHDYDIMCDNFVIGEYEYNDRYAEPVGYANYSTEELEAELVERGLGVEDL
jgi:hypothetical protein